MHLPRAAAGALLLALCAAGCALIPEHSDAPQMRVRGPIPERVQQPIKLGTLGFRPRRAATQAAGRTSLGIESTYSNIYQNGSGPGGQEVVLDAETWNNTLITTYGLSERADLELDLSVLYASNGFLDSVIESWHGFWGMPGGGREERPRDTYEMRVDTAGQTIYTLDPYEFSLLDTPLVFTERLVDEQGSTPAVALRAGVDLPTGSEARGTGNGGWDWGVGVLAEKSWERWTMTGALDWVDAKRPSSFVSAGVDVYDGFDVQLGLGVPLERQALALDRPDPHAPGDARLHDQGARPRDARPRHRRGLGHRAGFAAARGFRGGPDGRVGAGHRVLRGLEGWALVPAPLDRRRDHAHEERLGRSGLRVDERNAAAPKRGRA